MLALTSPYLWYTTRATGVVTLILLSASMVLGILTTTRVQSATFPRFAVSELHRRVTLVAMVFLAVHIVSTAVDSFVPIGWLPVVVPFISAYKPLWVGLGAVAFDTLLAVMVTSLLRRHISAPAWRAVHWLAYLSWPVAVAHGIGVGTDIRFGWLDVVVALCIASVLAAAGWRLYADPHLGGHRTAVPESANRVVGRQPPLAGPPAPAAGRPVASTPRGRR
jgi:predicted ferric reductase